MIEMIDRTVALRTRGIEPLEITEEFIEEFLSAQAEKGLSESSIQAYRRHLKRLYRELPEGDKRIYAGTVGQVKRQLLVKGYSVKTTNVFLSACNSLLEYGNRRELQELREFELSDAIQPELTRAEYQRLLTAARMLGDERAYLLVKLFAMTGVNVREICLLTVEGVQANRVATEKGPLHIPVFLRDELLGYARHEGLSGGPIFVTRAGKPMSRSSITIAIGRLCDAARVEHEKANPRCLRKLYQQTMSGIRSNLDLLIEQAHERMLEKEEKIIGW